MGIKPFPGQRLGSFVKHSTKAFVVKPPTRTIRIDASIGGFFPSAIVMEQLDMSSINGFFYHIVFKFFGLIRSSVPFLKMTNIVKGNQSWKTLAKNLGIVGDIPVFLDRVKINVNLHFHTVNGNYFHGSFFLERTDGKNEIREKENNSFMESTNSHIFKLKTIQCGPIRTLFESLKEIHVDTVLCCTEKGIKIVSADGTNIVLTHLFLYADKFEKYVCKRELFLGINVDNLYRLLKQINSSDVLTLFVKEQTTNLLHIRIQSTTKHTITNIAYRLLDIPYENMEITDDIETCCKLTIPTVELQSICRSMSQIGEHIEMICYKNRFIMRCSGGCCDDYTKTLFDNDNNIHLVVHPDYEDKIVHGKYLIKYINMFTRATNLCQNLELSIVKDQHDELVVKYTVANLGCLTFILARVTD